MSGLQGPRPGDWGLQPPPSAGAHAQAWGEGSGPPAHPISHHVLDPVTQARPLSPQIVKGLKFMLDLDISRTSCKKTRHSSLDDCSFQTNRTLKQVRGLWPPHRSPPPSQLRSLGNHPRHCSTCEGPDPTPEQRPRPPPTRESERQPPRTSQTTPLLAPTDTPPGSKHCRFGGGRRAKENLYIIEKFYIHTRGEQMWQNLVICKYMC